ncbi:MAG: metal-sulfur cluster assembly factor [Candidatus Micrarchaeota archaeon]
MATKDEVLGQLRKVLDPELGISIVDLGLIYKVEEKPKKKGKQQFYIEMTFTTPACPLIGYMESDIRRKLDELKNADFDVKIVFDPLWTPDRLSPAAKKQLGMK